MSNSCSAMNTGDSFSEDEEIILFASPEQEEEFYKRRRRHHRTIQEEKNELSEEEKNNNDVEEARARTSEQDSSSLNLDASQLEIQPHREAVISNGGILQPQEIAFGDASQSPRGRRCMQTAREIVSSAPEHSSRRQNHQDHSQEASSSLSQHDRHHSKKVSARKSVSSSSPLPSAAAAAAAAIQSPQQQQQHNSRVANVDTDVGTSGTSGLGQWRSWKRLFTNPLLALLDLLDNAFDAATVTAKAGRIHIVKDRALNNHSVPTGMAIYNSSLEPIRPQAVVLGRYVSTKGSASIGENGIGLNQGCATLTDLAFTLSKNTIQGDDGDRTVPSFGMGVLALRLQTEHEPNFPPIQFRATNLHDLKHEMLEIVAHDNGIADCVRDYGLGNLLTGVDRLMHHFALMTTDEKWCEFEHVFGLILHNLGHGKDNNTQGERVNTLLEQLSHDLPYRFLHIPKTLSVEIERQVVNFNYWQPRLVELAQFDLQINKQIPIHSDNFWNRPECAPPDTRDLYHTMRIYIGFDALRVNDDKATKTACLYIYSRESGRLIKKNEDARGELGLSNGGTDFCQGLTIILDDKYSALQLNPSKQGLSFAGAHGEVHQRNLTAWVGAATRMYYNFYKERICAKSKEVLTNAIKSMVMDVKLLVASSRNSFRSMSDCTFVSFGPFAASLWRQHTIKLVNMNSVDLRLGPDTKLKLPRNIAVPVNSRKRKAPPVPPRTEANQQSPSAPSPARAAAADREEVVYFGSEHGRRQGSIRNATANNRTAPYHVLLGQPSDLRERELSREIAQMSAIAYNERATRAQLARGMEAKHAAEVAQKDAKIKELQDELRKRDAIQAEEAVSLPSPSRPVDTTPSKQKLRLVISDLRLENRALRNEIAGLKQMLQNKDQLISQQRSRIDQFLEQDQSAVLDEDDTDSNDEDVERANI